jgi:hypothetical protein
MINVKPVKGNVVINLKFVGNQTTEFFANKSLAFKS